MKRWIAAALLLLPLAAQAQGRYARIAVLRPHDGDTIDFEAGYIRHLDWHRKANDPFGWYGWSIWAGERQRWFVYATFGHDIADFDHAVNPADDERDNVANVVPHAQFVANGLYEFLPALSKGNGVPTPTPRLELTTVDVAADEARAFEATLAAQHPSLQGETLWFRMLAGGAAPRYLRLRPRASLAALVGDPVALPSWKATVEILNFRPAMSYNVKE